MYKWTGSYSCHILGIDFVLVEGLRLKSNDHVMTQRDSHRSKPEGELNRGTVLGDSPSLRGCVGRWRWWWWWYRHGGGRWWSGHLRWQWGLLLVVIRRIHRHMMHRLVIGLGWCSVRVMRGPTGRRRWVSLGRVLRGVASRGPLPWTTREGGGQGAAEVAREVVQEAVGSPVAACCHCKPTYV